MLPARSARGYAEERINFYDERSKVMTLPLISMRQITKRFPGVIANNKINLELYPGEIHALLGENGSGKSTLMSILTGLYKPTEGCIMVGGEEVKFASPADAIASGIGMVHQHFKLIESFTVAENIVLSQSKGGFLLKPEQIIADIESLGEKYGLQVDPRAYVWQLGVGEKQRVEILRMLYHRSRVLILDEPTAVLTPQETRELFVNLRKMADDGCAVVFISHKLNEVEELADRVTVFARRLCNRQRRKRRYASRQAGADDDRPRGAEYL